MTVNNFYSPEFHGGDLPVRVLGGNVIIWLETITPTFLDEVKERIKNHQFDPGIEYNITEEKIKLNDVPQLFGNKIVLYENFNQYIWCICYSILVLFEEGINKPIIEGRFKNKMDLANNKIVEAHGVLETGLSLFREYDKHSFYLLANPETYDPVNQEYVGISNAIYSAAMVFVLLHEYAHHLHGDQRISSPDIMKKQEYEADAYAYKKMAESFSTKNGETNKIGIILGMSALILCNERLDGGASHPDPEDRVVKALEFMNLDDKAYVWGIAGFALQVWSIEYGAILKLPDQFENYKESFISTFTAIKSNKN
jgi:hypothetical protein